jgi:hypothetical protein
VALSAALKRKVVILEMVASLHEKERDGLTELVNAGIDVREIILHLWTIWQACRPVPLVAIPDVPLKELRKLPKRLRRIAHLIDAIREHRLMPSLVHYSSRRALPPSLRLYARDLEKRLTAPQKRNAGNVEPGTKEKIGFIFYVRATTKDKEPHYKALAAVINAFNQLGDKRCGGNSKKVTEDSLKQLYQSHPDLRVAPPHLEMS